MRLIKRIKVNSSRNTLRMNFKIMKFGSLGENVRFGGISTLLGTEHIYLADNVFIGPECYFHAISDIKISSGCMLGPRIFCISGSHNYNSPDLKAVPYDDRQVDLPVVIDCNVWVAGNVSIAPGTHIGEGSVVAMGATVAGEIPPYSVVVGNKARPVKNRNIERYKTLVEQELIYNKVFAGKPFQMMRR